MKKKVVLRVQMCCDRCRTKALQTVASINGVQSLALQGAERNMVVVAGEEIDPVIITEKLRKKVGHTELVEVERIVSGRDEPDDDDEYNHRWNRLYDRHQWPAAGWDGYPTYIAPCQVCEAITRLVVALFCERQLMNKQSYDHRSMYSSS